MFVTSFHYLRGIAILTIVAAHVHIGQGNSDYPIITNLIAGSTALFVFISGYLFQYLKNEQFDYRHYLQRKFKFVIAPYLICSVPALIYIVATGNFHPLLGDVSDVRGSLLNIVTGRHVTAYWYIPFAMLLFLSAPLAIYFSNIRLEKQLLIMVVLAIIASFAHRSVGGLNAIHSFIYYYPLYLFGIFAAANPAIIMQLRKYSLLFLFTSLALAYYQGVIEGIQGSKHKALFEYAGIDLMFLQKVFLLLFIMTSIHHLSRWQIKPLSFFANISFGLFFIHGYVLMVLQRVSINDLLLNYGFSAETALLIKFTLVVMISSLIAVVIMKLLGKNSRYVIGS